VELSEMKRKGGYGGSKLVLSTHLAPLSPGSPENKVHLSNDKLALSFSNFLNSTRLGRPPIIWPGRTPRDPPVESRTCEK